MGPQRDIPSERITHYIVKDYRNMYNSFHAMHDELQGKVDKLTEKLEKKSRAVANLQAENEKLKEQVKELQATRKVSAPDEDAEEKLSKARLKINILMQAIQDPDIVYRLNAHTLTTDDDMEWMEKADKQLEKALLSLITVSARMKELEEQVSYGTEKGVLKKINMVYQKIDSCVNHIEDFFRKTGYITIEYGQSDKA